VSKAFRRSSNVMLLRLLGNVKRRCRRSPRILLCLKRLCRPTTPVRVPAGKVYRYACIGKSNSTARSAFPAWSSRGLLQPNCQSDRAFDQETISKAKLDWECSARSYVHLTCSLLCRVGQDPQTIIEQSAPKPEPPEVVYDFDL
jgi:hypothetical protein